MARGILIAVLSAWIVAAADPHTAKVEEWRRKYEAGLKAESGWLAVAGLFWLKQGENTVGSDASLDIVLPEGAAPKRVGSMFFDGRSVRFRDSAGRERTLQSDKVGEPDVLEIGRLKLTVIDRSGKIGVRLRDPASKMRREFQGVRWYPVKSEYVVKAKFAPYAKKKPVTYPDVTGNRQVMMSPGTVEFKMHGQRVTLEPVEEDNELFFVFKDRTAGKTTYGAGRMLYSPMPKDGMVEIDFNQAKNPPCTYTPFATCPLPLRRNSLPVAIEAGELVPAGHDAGK